MKKEREIYESEMAEKDSIIREFQDQNFKQETKSVS